MMLSLARRSVFTAVRRAAPMSTATSISQASDLNKRLEESDPVLFDIIENEKVRVASVVIRTGVLVQTVEVGPRERGRGSVGGEHFLHKNDRRPPV